MFRHDQKNNNYVLFIHKLKLVLFYCSGWAGKLKSTYYETVNGAHRDHNDLPVLLSQMKYKIVAKNNVHTS